MKYEVSVPGGRTFMTDKRDTPSAETGRRMKGNGQRLGTLHAEPHAQTLACHAPPRCKPAIEPAETKAGPVCKACGLGPEYGVHHDTSMSEFHLFTWPPERAAPVSPPRQALVPGVSIESNTYNNSGGALGPKEKTCDLCGEKMPKGYEVLSINGKIGRAHFECVDKREVAPVSPPVQPFYCKVAQDDGKATQLYMISCNEGWRESIVCNDMYEWAADWLVDILQGRPYAPGKH